MTVNGACLRTGDLFASETVSGPLRGQRGSLLELTWGGAEPLELADGTIREFLEDGDEVVISATAPGVDGEVVSFGDVRGQVVACDRGSQRAYAGERLGALSECPSRGCLHSRLSLV
jgi:fumarylacetoacetase